MNRSDEQDYSPMRETLEDIESGSVKDPMKVAEPSRQAQLPKRFYEKVEIAETDDGFAIHLDGRAVKTPLRSVLQVSTANAAKLLAEEWQAQKEHIDPLTMPVTRLINTAIDGVARDVQAVKEDIVRFASSDLLCYRADGPKELLDRQQEHWDPLIDWAQTSLNARFILVEGIMHSAQPGETIAAINSHVGLIDDPAKLALLHSMTSISGSAIIALAVFKQAVDLDNAWIAAHVDEDWQISQWGEDEEAEALRAARKRDFDAAVKLLQALENA